MRETHVSTQIEVISWAWTSSSAVTQQPGNHIMRLAAFILYTFPLHRGQDSDPSLWSSSSSVTGTICQTHCMYIFSFMDHSNNIFLLFKAFYEQIVSGINKAVPNKEPPENMTHTCRLNCFDLSWFVYFEFLNTRFLFQFCMPCDTHPMTLMTQTVTWGFRRKHIGVRKPRQVVYQPTWY